MSNNSKADEINIKVWGQNMAWWSFDLIVTLRQNFSSNCDLYSF